MKQAQTSRQRINGAKTGKGIPLLMASNYRKEHLSNTDYASASQGGIKIADMIRAREFIKETRQVHINQQEDGKKGNNIDILQSTPQSNNQRLQKLRKGMEYLSQQKSKSGSKGAKQVNNLVKDAF